MRRFFYNLNSLQTVTQSATFNGSSVIDGERAALNKLAIGSLITLTDDIYYHWCRVLRAKVGDQSQIFDGLGGQTTIELEAIDKKSAQARLLHHDNIDNSSNFYSTIAIVMSRGDKMDYAIQKSTELGATAIQLLTSQHGEVRLKANQVDKKLNHWQQVAISACEQCGLNRPPLVLSPFSIEEWFVQLQLKPQLDLHDEVSYILDDSYYQNYLKQAPLPLVMAVPSQQELQKLDIDACIHKHFNLSTRQNITSESKPRFDILIGAEGGLSELEYAKARELGFLPWQLGNRVLRTETAPVVALATLNYIGKLY
ncbi:16S rRNA (uracil(1498)-N(3))-methyltransferase [Psychrobacter sp.]|uniref:16S rRNA (uracil(1498)-N(3))-methyltransferase n=1 Tax=Psychrobacter sp. TaxID=56811 RepID=UPI0025E46C1D|nr:16S rRNA (uracil(1498)-N(3))-methyltransferase [Psychrobacter sp.]